MAPISSHRRSPYLTPGLLTYAALSVIAYTSVALSDDASLGGGFWVLGWPVLTALVVYFIGRGSENVWLAALLLHAGIALMVFVFGAFGTSPTELIYLVCLFLAPAALWSRDVRALVRD